MKIGFVGFGNMASAMADGWIAAGVAASDMCACAGTTTPWLSVVRRVGWLPVVMRRRLSLHPISWLLRSSHT